MPFDVFISHASKDKLVANAVCARLEGAGIRCWIAPRDITAGTSYGEAIIEAIHEVKVMVLVFSSNANTSGHIPKEIERAVSNGLTIVPLRIEDVAPGKSLDYFIGSIHWLDAMTPPLEKHLDELVETIRKLLPRQPGPRPTPSPTPQPPVPWPAVPSPAGGRTGRAISPKTLGIGAAAVLLIAAIVWGVTQLGPKPPVNPEPPAPTPVVNPSPTPPGGNPGPIAATSADPIVGCYHWFNNGQVVIHSNGTIVGGPFTGHWRRVSAAQRTYQFDWPRAIDTVTISADQRSLGGMNQYQYPISATRTAGTFGLVGSWNLSNNVPMLVFPNGTFTAATFTGTWRTVDASRGSYSMTWPDPIDSVTLSPDDQLISGANQYGVAISGSRTEPCAAN
jgi:hypothetical protein